jgi:hypothetical protein
MIKIPSILFFLVTTVFLHSCDKTITLPIDDADGKKIDFLCGSVSISASKSFGLGYTISHQFNLINQVTLYFDSLKIENKGAQLEFEITDETGKSIAEKILNVSNKKYINLHIRQNLQTGDTLVVYVKGFIICNGVSIYNDSLRITLNDHP